MNRRVKQILYGIFYIFILFFLVKGVYGLFFTQAPSCSDETQNQGEVGVDCGGPCQSCDLANLEDLRIQGDIKKFSFQSNNFAFIEVSNPNSDYNGDFQYKVTFYDESDRVLDESYSSSYIVSLSSDYLISPLSEDFNRVGFEVLSVDWIKSSESIEDKPKVENKFMKFNDKNVVVEGVVRNPSSSNIEEIKVIALFKDKLGFNNLIFNQTVLSNFSAFEEREFSIELELNDELRNSISLENTEILISINK